MSELYAVTVQTNAPVRTVASPLIGAALSSVAQQGKLAGIPRFKKEPQLALDELVAQLAALPSAKAAKALPASSKLLPAAQAMKALILHLAHPDAFDPPTASHVVLQVRTIHPDAFTPKPKGSDTTGKLDTFVVRLLADGSKANHLRSRYGDKLLKPNLRVSSEDLWDFDLGRWAKAAAPSKDLPGKYFETSLEVMADTATVAHLAPGDRYSSTAFLG
ncbi:MAG: hypothetical protein NT062_32380 [Proteobacteria bacterium]|nr:hypothetical protein [Pseudomonadota bacterium]